MNVFPWICLIAFVISIIFQLTLYGSYDLARGFGQTVGLLIYPIAPAAIVALIARKRSLFFPSWVALFFVFILGTVFYILNATQSVKQDQTSHENEGVSSNIDFEESFTSPSLFTSPEFSFGAIFPGEGPEVLLGDQALGRVLRLQSLEQNDSGESFVYSVTASHAAPIPKGLSLELFLESTALMSLRMTDQESFQNTISLRYWRNKPVVFYDSAYPTEYGDLRKRSMIYLRESDNVIFTFDVSGTSRDGLEERLDTLIASFVNFR